MSKQNPSPRSPRMTTTPAADSVLLLSPSTLPRWRLLRRILLRPIWPSFSRICFREKSRVSIRHWCIRYPYLSKSSLNLHVHPSSSLQVPPWCFTLIWLSPYTSSTRYRIGVPACFHNQASSSLPSSSIAIPSSAAMSSLHCQSSWNAPFSLGLPLDSSPS